MTTDGTTGGSILMRKLLKKAKDEGVKLLVNTKAFALVTDPEGNVTGVQAKTPDGVKSFMATKGVIITSTSSVFLLPTQR